MSDQEIKVGDVVSLKSGGPWMTVEAVEEKSHRASQKVAKCVFFVHIEADEWNEWKGPETQPSRSGR